MPRVKLNYREGDVFVLPVDRGGYALGVVARMDRSGGVLGYFFGPRLAEPPACFNPSSLRPENAITAIRCGDLRLIENQWPVLGPLPEWTREEWPMPRFARFPPGGFDPPRLVEYHPETLNHLRERDATAEELEGLPTDGLFGARAVEIHLRMLLSGQPSVPNAVSPALISLDSNAKKTTEAGCHHEASDATDSQPAGPPVLQSVGEPTRDAEQEDDSATDEAGAEENEVKLLLEYPLDGWGEAADLDRRYAIEDLLDERLVAAGLGYCDGGSTGSGSMDVDCRVQDPEQGLAVLLAALRERGWLAGATVYQYAEDERTVVFPRPE